MSSYPNPPGGPGQPPPGYGGQPPQGYGGPPPPSGYGGQPPGYPPHYGPPGYPPQAKSKTPLIIAGVVGALAVLGAIAVMLMPGDAQAGEVILVPAASVGPDPFSATPFAPPPNPTLAQPAVEGGPPVGAAPGAAPTQATSGAKPGLYGGTNDKKACDPKAMVDFLGANPDKAQAWVNALTADPAVRLKDGQPLTVAYIPHYVAGLTPITLMEDVRVTNHGFKNGRANQIQSVLQKGSAVLIDEFGVPRVKCYCGNPLLPPVASSAPPVYSGPRWPDFEPARITTVTPPPQPIEVLVVVLVEDPGQTLDLVPGSGDPGLEMYMVGGPPPRYPDDLDESSEKPTPPRASAPSPRGAVPPRAPAPPAYDPYDCSVNDCDDETEDYEALEEAVRQQEAADAECVLYDEEAGRGFRVSCDTPGAQRL